MRHIKHLVVQSLGTPPSDDIGVRELDRRDREAGFLGIGYHFVVRRDGRVEKGRALQRASAFIPGHNSNSIAICMVGGENENGHELGNYMTEQFDSLLRLLSGLSQTFPDAEVMGHRDLLGSATSSPHFNVRVWWSYLN